MKKNITKNNLAFVDGQNLYMGTNSEKPTWKVDLVKFRKHNSAMVSKKKGNVDTDIVFDIMKRMYKKEPFDKIVLVAGDGDYKTLVDFLIEEEKFEKILFPNKQFASSLYKKLPSRYYDCLNNIKYKIKRSP